MCRLRLFLRRKALPQSVQTKLRTAEWMRTWSFIVLSVPYCTPHVLHVNRRVYRCVL